MHFDAFKEFRLIIVVGLIIYKYAVIVYTCIFEIKTLYE